MDELFRRLERHRQHLDEARERRRAKTGKKAASEEYHHVPQCAAADFVRTTTADVRTEKSIHPLSRPVARTRIARPKSDGHLVASRMPLSQVVQDHDLAQLKMLLNAKRNQFTQNSASARAAEVDKERNVHKLPQRDFDFSRSTSMSNKTKPPRDRSNSLNNRSGTMTEGRGRSKSYLPTFDERESHFDDVGPIPRPHHIQNHTDRRHDWSQHEATVTGDGLGQKAHLRNAKTSSPLSRLFLSKAAISSKLGVLPASPPKEKTLMKRRSGFFAILFHRADPAIPT